MSITVKHLYSFNNYVSNSPTFGINCKIRQYNNNTYIYVLDPKYKRTGGYGAFFIFKFDNIRKFLLDSIVYFTDILFIGCDDINFNVSKDGQRIVCVNSIHDNPKLLVFSKTTGRWKYKSISINYNKRDQFSIYNISAQNFSNVHSLVSNIDCTQTAINVSFVQNNFTYYMYYVFDTSSYHTYINDLINVVEQPVLVYTNETKNLFLKNVRFSSLYSFNNVSVYEKENIYKTVTTVFADPTNTFAILLVSDKNNSVLYVYSLVNDKLPAKYLLLSDLKSTTINHFIISKKLICFSVKQNTSYKLYVYSYDYETLISKLNDVSISIIRDSVISNKINKIFERSETFKFANDISISDNDQFLSFSTHISVNTVKKIYTYLIEYPLPEIIERPTMMLLEDNNIQNINDDISNDINEDLIENINIEETPILVEKNTVLPTSNEIVNEYDTYIYDIDNTYEPLDILSDIQIERNTIETGQIEDPNTNTTTNTDTNTSSQQYGYVYLSDNYKEIREALLRKIELDTYDYPQEEPNIILDYARYRKDILIDFEYDTGAIFSVQEDDYTLDSTTQVDNSYSIMVKTNNIKPIAVQSVGTIDIAIEKRLKHYQLLMGDFKYRMYIYYNNDLYVTDLLLRSQQVYGYIYLSDNYRELRYEVLEHIVRDYEDYPVNEPEIIVDFETYSQNILILFDNSGMIHTLDVSNTYIDDGSIDYGDNAILITTTSISPADILSVGNNLITVDPRGEHFLLTSDVGFTYRLYIYFDRESRMYIKASDFVISTTSRPTTEENMVFVLTGLDIHSTILELGDLGTFETESLSGNAIASIDISASVMSNMFMFQTDAFSINDIINEDIQYRNISGEWDTLDINIPNANMTRSIYSYSNNDTIKEDYIRYLSDMLFDTEQAADLFSNEDELLEELEINVANTLNSNIKTLLEENNNVEDKSTHFVHKLFTQLVNSDTGRNRLIGLNISEDYQNFPFVAGDILSFKVKLNSEPEQHLLTGLENAIEPRSYIIRLRLV